MSKPRKPAPPTLKDGPEVSVKKGEPKLVDEDDFDERTLRTEPRAGQPVDTSSSQMPSIAAVMPISTEHPSISAEAPDVVTLPTTAKVLRPGTANASLKPDPISGLWDSFPSVPGVTDTNPMTSPPQIPSMIGDSRVGESARTDEIRPHRAPELDVVLERIAAACAELERVDDIRAPWLRAELRALLAKLGKRV